MVDKKQEGSCDLDNLKLSVIDVGLRVKVGVFLQCVIYMGNLQ